MCLLVWLCVCVCVRVPHVTGMCVSCECHSRIDSLSLSLSLLPRLLPLPQSLSLSLSLIPSMPASSVTRGGREAKGLKQNPNLPALFTLFPSHFPSLFPFPSLPSFTSSVSALCFSVRDGGGGSRCRERNARRAPPAHTLSSAAPVYVCPFCSCRPDGVREISSPLLPSLPAF